MNRYLKLMLGLFLYGVGIVATIRADIGYAPWEVFHIGISNVTGISIGTASIIIGLLLIILTSLGKEKFGLGTIANIVIIGILIDIFLYLEIIPKFDSLPLQILEMVVGMFIISFATWLYIDSGFGAGPRDSLMVLLARYVKLPIGVIRSSIELLVTFLGWLMGGRVWLGTLIVSFGIGFCVQAVFRLVRFDPRLVEHEDIIFTIKSWGRREEF